MFACRLHRVVVGNLWPAKQHHPARSPFTNCSNCMARPVLLYFMNLPSLQLLVSHTYEGLLMRKRTVLYTYCMSYFVLPLRTVKIRS